MLREKKFRRHQQRTFFWLLISMRVLSGEKRVFPPLFAGMTVRSCCCCCPSSSTVAMLKSGCGKKASYSLSLSPPLGFYEQFCGMHFPRKSGGDFSFFTMPVFFLFFCAFFVANRRDRTEPMSPAYFFDWLVTGKFLPVSFSFCDE